ncbi:diacylglycerol kinase family protein [Mucilaginibacter segetis]|uniref:Diacylglycerol kinase family protein n=1 Tax=Mucilaginibacter segetis TaxID=2793071 RepID=A0A934PT13_9SPHI|nr:diacylglycerol kinase family protein [Mucilaginibacter segetis]MBK0378515.1 diacylglycerol kinase family protein [Mucilaginibacter segetis]
MADTNFYKLGRSFRYAFQGFHSGFRSQLNFRIQCTAAVVVIILGLLCGITKYDWLWILLNIALVLFGELINTALETLVDLVSPDYHVLAGKVKDIAAAAVTILAANALVSAIIIFSGPFLKLWG